MSNAKQVLKDFLNEHGHIRNDLFHGEYEDIYDKGWGGDSLFQELIDNGFTELSLQDRYGGEGQGEEYWSVYLFKTSDETFFVKFDGYYASYNGADFNDWFFVEPKQVMVTKYFLIK